MDEEEEVDIVGGYDGFMSKNEREISNISSGQILSCDYTVHPQWLNDTAHWPENFPKQSSQDEMEMVKDEVVIEEPAPIDFNNWCDETNSNCGDLILEQDIPATLEEEVITNSGTEEADDSEIYSTTSAGSTDDLRQIMPSPSSVSSSSLSTMSSSLPPTVAPGVQIIKQRTVSVHFSNPRSLLKKNLLGQQYHLTTAGIGIDRPPSKFRKTLLVNKSLLKNNQKNVLNLPSTVTTNETTVSSLSKLPTPISSKGNTTKEFLSILESTKKCISSQNTTANTSNTTITCATAKKSTTMPAPLPNSKLPLNLANALKDGKHYRNIKSAPKFRQTVKLPKNDNIFQSKAMRKISKNLNERNHIRNTARKETSGVVDMVGGDAGGGGKITFRSGGKGKRGGKKFVDLHGENITINHDVEGGSSLNSRTVVDDQFSTPLSRSITILQNDSDDDLDIDIESSDTSPQQILLLTTQSNETTIRPPVNKVGKSTPKIQPIVPKLSTTDTKPPITFIVKSEPVSQSPPASLSSSKSFILTSDSKLEPILNSCELPTEEYQIKLTEISELEKFFHSEFFEGRPTKTPERYLKIRNYILTTWNQTRPTYISKTAVRNGLKHCGDVNCISRIHSLLEQIGAINFGCDQCYYIRPLRDLLEWFSQTNRNKSTNTNNYNINTNNNSSSQLGSASSSEGIGLFLDRRQRVSKPIKQSSSSAEYDLLQQDTALVIDANYTVSHVDGTVVTGGRNIQASRNQRKNYRLTDSDDSDDENVLDRRKINSNNSQFQLIKCLRFNRQNDIDKTPPFLLSIKLSTLLCMHLHSFSSKHEIMGFLGGQTTRESTDQKIKLTLCRYKPCKTSAQSSTMCEMCPVSQVEQANNLITEGYDLLGWFHSHPTFPANPSRTDVATQSDMQLQFSIDQHDRPFVGLILSLIDMRLRCMYILPEDLRLINMAATDININDHQQQQQLPQRNELIVPYEIDIDIVKDSATLKSEIIDVFNVIDKNCDQYPLTIKQFTSSATNFLQQIGYSPSILATLNNIL